ncbi:MAG: hypothetical protein QNJ54_36730 [Prochloraceae cyanobacterium]|nr:hypothetical protein [Prochloraceae cyanobacterium]
MLKDKEVFLSGKTLVYKFPVEKTEITQEEHELLEKQKTKILDLIFDSVNLKKMKLYQCFTNEYLQEYIWIEVTKQEVKNTLEFFEWIHIWDINEYYFNTEEMMRIGKGVGKQLPSSYQDKYHFEIHFTFGKDKFLGIGAEEEQCFCAYLGEGKPALY